MKNKARKNLNKEDSQNLILTFPKHLKERCENEDISLIINKFESAKTVEEQITTIHSFSTFLNDSSNDNISFILHILCTLFVNANSKSPAKKTIFRIFASTKSLESQIFLTLSQQLMTLMNFADLGPKHYKYNECVNNINDCLSNNFAGIGAISLISEKVFLFLIKSLNTYLIKIRCEACSPTDFQVQYKYIHNSTRALVAVLQQCTIEDLDLSYYNNEIYKICIIILNNPDILYDTKNNCGIILINVANNTMEHGYSSVLQNLLKWDTESQDFKDEVVVTCIFSGILNTVETEQLCGYNESFRNSHIFKITKKLLELSKNSADKPSIILAINRTLLTLSRSLKPLNNENLIEILSGILDQVWTQLDHFVDTIRHVSKSILINLVKVAAGRTKDGQNNPLDTIIDSILKTSSFKNGRYVALSIIANEVGCASLLLKEPNLITKLLELSQDSSISSYVISCYENLMRCHLKETKEVTDWLKLWVLPLTSELGQEKELDQKGSCLQKLLVIAIKLRPSILNYILHQWSIDNELQFSSLLKCTLIARKIGADLKEDKNKWRGILDYNTLDLAMCHQNDEIRISALSLIAESHKSIEIFNEWELKFIVRFLNYNINTQLPSSRQEILFLIKKVLTRFSESYYAIVRNSLKLCEKNNFQEDSHYNTLQQQKRIYENFIFELRDHIFDSLFPGANFSRRIICLEVLTFLEPILAEVLKVMCISSDKVWKKSEAEALLLCLSDSYESNKQLATNLLKKCPVDLLKLDTVENTKEFINNALQYASSVKPADTVTAAYMLETSMYSPVITNVLKDLLPANLSKCTPQFLIINLLLNSLKEQVEIGNKSLIKAAASAPMHGTLFCIRHLMEIYLFTSNLSESYWLFPIADIIETCFQVSKIVCPVVNSSSPEGHLPMDHETIDEDDEEIITAQMLLVCSWRSIKEVSLLLGEVTLKAAIVNENQNGLITENQMLKIGEHFTVLLTETKHRGAFEQAYVGFTKLCNRLWRCKSQNLHQLPVAWLHNIISAISGIRTAQNSKLCATRRSAGVPFMIQAIIASELQTGGSTNFHQCMTTLLAYANYPGESIEVRTHAMNILRALYRHTQLGEEISPYVSDGIIVAITGFGRKTWAERNSATLLFSSLMTRIFGVQRTKDPENLNIRNKMTTRVFFLRHPTLYPFLLDQLKRLTANDCEHDKEVALYPILLLLARLYPASLEESDSNKQLQDFIPYIRSCANNRTLNTRELAAKALFPLVPSHQRNNLLKELFIQLKESNISKNVLHGTLLQILYLLPINNEIDSLEITTTIWLLKYDSPGCCAVTAALYMQIISKIFIKCELQLEIKDAIMSTIYKQDNYIQTHCLIGKTVYYRQATYLQIFILMQKSEKQLCDYLITNLGHENQDVKEFILNFFICIFKNSETAVLIENLELPDEEKLLLNFITNEFKSSLLVNVKENIPSLITKIKQIILSENVLLSKALFLISNFEQTVLEFVKEENYFSFFKTQIYLGDEDVSTAVLLCIPTLLKHFPQNMNEILEILLEFSSSKYNLNCRYCVALTLIQNCSLLFGEVEIDMDNLIIFWRIVMILLADNEPVIRNTISKLAENQPVAEKAREELLLKCINHIKSISDKHISLLLFWSITDIDFEDNDEETELQIFERGEISTYIEDMCLSKLSAKMLSNIIDDKNSSDIPIIFLKLSNILKNDDKLWYENLSDRNILLSIFEEIQSLIENPDESINIIEKYLSTQDNTWSSLNIFYQYKVLNILQSVAHLSHE